MVEMKVKICNVEKMTEGDHVSAWFDCPVNPDNVIERLGLKSGAVYEYAFEDYELPFEWKGESDINELNRLCNMILELEHPLCEAVKSLLKHYRTVDNLYNNRDTIRYYSGCSDMKDVARVIIEESDSNLPEGFEAFIDLNKYGAYLMNTRHFICTSAGIFECYV